MDDNFQQLLILEIRRLLHPLVVAAQSEFYRRELFDSIGWNIDAVPGLNGKIVKQLDAFVTAYKQFEQYVEKPPQTLGEVTDALRAVSPVFGAVQGLQKTFKDVGAVLPVLDQMVEELLHRVILIYLLNWHPAIYHLATLLTIIEHDEPVRPAKPLLSASGDVMLYPHRPSKVRFDRIAGLLKDPVGVLKARYFVNELKTAADARRSSDALFPPLVSLLAEFNLNAAYGVEIERELKLGELGNALAQRMLTLRYDKPLGETGVVVGASLLLLSEEEGGPGVSVTPFGAAKASEIFDGWALGVTLLGDVTGFSVGARGVTLLAQAAARVAGDVTLSKLPEVSGQAFLLGSTTGTRLEVADFNVKGDFSFDTKGEREFGIGVEVGSAALVLSAGDGDGFLKKVLPEDVRVPFDLAVGWSNRRGLHFRGSAGLEATLPVNASLLGVLNVESVHLAVRPGDEGDIRTIAALSATVKLGPVTAVIERTGIEARFKFLKAGETGNLGPVDLSVGFKPPNGAGLTIDTNVVVGGGYLFFDAEREQYAGALQLELGGKVALSAIGLLTTRLPGGAKGFSLLVLISAEFPPIQLGYGFTLNGVGGLIGVNRTANAEVLRAGIKTGTLNSVLFPPDPAQNALEVISNLQAIFPPAENRYLIGPMAKIGWGTPTILTIEVGLILELPSPVRLLILGRLRAVLPSEEKPLVRLQMDALGVVDFDRREISLDATLYDSRLLEFVLTGDMALRVNWGAQPNFVLAIGGFNPRFKAPANFPKLERVALSLQSSENLRLRLETYLALTSNTAQFGARLDLHVAAGGFTVDAYLFFDALFHFSPFHFIVDIGAMAALKYKGHSLVGVRFDITLSGPTPWHVRGEATFEILGFEASVSFDRKFGREELPPPPPAVEIRPQLVEALRDARNWTGQLAEHPLVSLRDHGEPAAEKFLVHPLSTLTIRQRVVPLDTKITRFGNAAPGDADFFALDVLREDGTPLSDEFVNVDAVEDYFAPAQFQELTDAQKLGSASFKLMHSGINFDVDEILYEYDPALDVDIEFETVVYNPAPGGAPDEPARNVLAAPQGISTLLLETAANIGAAGQARVRQTGAERYRADDHLAQQEIK